jgi:ABC-2 type transport system permease protein
MFERVKILTLLQLSNKSRLYQRNSKRIYSHIAIRAFIVVLITIAMAFILHFVKNIIYIPVNANFLIFILIVTQGLSIIVSVVGLDTDLYHSKDNQILFSLPAKNDEIFMSKMVIHYLSEFLRNIFLLVPILIAFGIINSLTVVYFLTTIPIIILLPAISVSVATLLSIPLTITKNYLKQHHLVMFLMTLVGLGFLFFLTYQIVSQIPTPIRIVQLYNQFIISITRFMQQTAAYGLIYTVIGKLLFQVNYVFNFLIVIVSSVALVGLNYFIAKPLYFKLISASQENTVKKNKKLNARNNKTLFFTFLNKEFTIARRSTNELLSNYSLLLTLPFFMYILNFIYMGMNRSTFGNQLVLILNVFITLLIVTGSNTASATAITTEGYEFILLKTAPYNTSKMAWAKVTFNLLFTIVIITLSFLLFSNALPVFPKNSILLLYFFIIIVNSGHIFMSFQIDILSPKLSDYAATGSLSNNVNVSKSLTYGLTISIMFGILAVILFIFAESIGWYVMIGLGVCFMLYRIVSFQAHLKAYFIDIEY